MTPVLVAISLIFFTAAAFYRRSWGIAIILLFLPAYLIRFKLFSIPLTLLEAYILILFVAWAWQWWREHRGLKSSWRAFRACVPTPFLRLSLLWVAAGLAACFWSNTTIAGLGLWKAYFLEPVLFAFVLFFSLDKTSNRQWFIRCLGLCVALIGLISLAQAFHIVPSPLPWSEQVPPRFSSMFEYPNAVGLLVAPIVALFIGLLADSSQFGRNERWLIRCVLLFGILAIGAAVSEGALLGLLSAVAVLALIDRRRKRWIILGLVGLAIVVAIPQTRNYLTDLATFSDTSGDVRLRLWTGTIDLLKAHPIEGAGLGGFPALYDKYRDAAHVELLLYPHNEILNVWVELGLAGLVLFIAFIIRFYRLVVRAYRRSADYDRAVSLGLILAMTALLGHGLVDAPYFKNDLAVLFFVLIVFAEFLGRKQQSSQ